MEYKIHTKSPKPFDLCGLSFDPTTKIGKRFWSRVDQTETCWNWKGNKVNGYGSFWLDGALRKAHRVSFLLQNGSLDLTKVIDHLCRNRSCVNPGHLREVLHKENTLCGEGIAAKYRSQTKCKRGHELTKDNLRPCKSGVEWRRCLKCYSDYQKKYSYTYYRKNKEGEEK